MKLINQSAEIWQQPEGEVGIYKQVEKAARLCYKSEDKITEDSYKKFIDMISSKGHYSPFEHGTVYLMFFVGEDIENYDEIWKVANSPYSRKNRVDNVVYITTNYRVIIENNALEAMKTCLCRPTEYHAKRISVHITTSIGISRELNRHRCHSICEESTRYCNYSKDKFGNELTFIIPNWVNTHCPNDNQEGPSVADIAWSDACKEAEDSYFQLVNGGMKPQQAREVLPLSTKTELIHTAFEDDWEEFFQLRCSSAAHPMMQELANKIKELIHGNKD